MTLEITMDCPTCPARLTFSRRAGRAQGRMWSRCRSCGEAFTLWGGRVQLLGGPSLADGIPDRHLALDP